MEAFITELNTGMSATAIWGTVGEMAPLMITLFLVAIAYYVLRRVTKGGSKLKFKI